MNFDLVVPSSWEELTQKQLVSVYKLMSLGYAGDELKLLVILKFSGCRVVGRKKGSPYWIVTREGYNSFVEVSPVQFAALLPAVGWLSELPSSPIRLVSIRGFQAVDAYLQGVSFDVYLCVENLYQGYLATHDEDLIAQIAEYLYKPVGLKKILRRKSMRIRRFESLSIFFWLAALKAFFSKQFPNFFQPYNPTAEPDNLLGPAPKLHLQDVMNAQIRALTKGDVTKEKEILELDTWRALTELDAQAKEFRELEAQRKS